MFIYLITVKHKLLVYESPTFVSPPFAASTCTSDEGTSAICDTRRDRAPVTSEIADGWQRRFHNWSDRGHWTVRQNRISDQIGRDLRYRVEVRRAKDTSYGDGVIVMGTITLAIC